MKDSSGIGVLDKVVAVLDHLSHGAASLPELTQATRLPKPTVHRLLQGLLHHGVLQRDEDARYLIGPAVSLWSAAGETESLIARSRPQLEALRDATGLSAQLYVRSGRDRLCVAVSEPASGLRDTVPVGSALTLQAGSAAQVLLAWAPDADELLIGAAFNRAALNEVRRNGYAQSAGEREPGVASVSAPVLREGKIRAAISVSGPVERMTKNPGTKYANQVMAAGEALSS